MTLTIVSFIECQNLIELQLHTEKYRSLEQC